VVLKKRLAEKKINPRFVLFLKKNYTFFKQLKNKAVNMGTISNILKIILFMLIYFKYFLFLLII